MKYSLKNLNYFVRDDQDVSVVLIKDNAQRFLLNRTGKMIFDNIINCSDTESVINKMKAVYPNVSSDILEQDVTDIFNIMNIYDIVHREEESNSADDQETIEAVNEDDYKKLSDYIIKNMNNKCLISNKVPAYFGATSIRARIMTNSEYYYCVKKNGKFELVISVKPNIENTNVVLITNIIFDKELEFDSLKKSFEALLKHINKNMVKKITKFRMTFLSKTNLEDDNVLLKMMSETGFELETVLEKETEEENLYMYSKYM